MNQANDTEFAFPEKRDRADKPLEPVHSASESDISIVLTSTKPKKRRRSSLLQRLSLFDNRLERQGTEGNKQSQVDNLAEVSSNSGGHKQSQDESLAELSSNSGQSKNDNDSSNKMNDLREYADQLNAEQIAWSKARRDWRQQCKTTINELHEHPMVLDETSSLDFLTDEDRKFLKARPDYETIKREMQEGLELATLCMVMEERYQNAMQSLVNMARDRQEPIKKYILNMD